MTLLLSAVLRIVTILLTATARDVESSVNLAKLSYCVRLTDLTLSCAAKARVPKPKRRAGCRD
jgi:hypothetical protein